MSYTALSIGLFIFILAYFTWNVPAPKAIPEPIPKTPQQQEEVIQYCQIVDSDSALIFTAPQDNNTKCPNGPGGSYKSGGVSQDNLFGDDTEYKLIRKSVPLNRSFFTKEDGSDHSTLASDAGIETSLDPNKYRLYFPQISGEISIGKAPYSRTRDCGDRSYENTSRMYFIDYGLAFGLILKDGKPIEVSGTAIGGGQAVFWLTDVFKDVNRDDQIPPEAFTCDLTNSTNLAKASLAPIGVKSPQQKKSTDSSQLQLEYFIFGKQNEANKLSGSVVNGWIDTCKPAIYLYPPKQELVNVKVTPKGYLSYTDPPYDSDKGWTVNASPDGSLFTLNYEPITGNYLYFESKIYDEVIKKPTSGWVRKFDELTDFYSDILPRLGLNQKQTQDFIAYWQKALPYSPYYFVGIIDQENVNQFEKLDITPKPDSINRVRVYFERLDSQKAVVEPDLSSISASEGGAGDFKFKISNSRFSVVEWGGMVKNDPNHPFTCSQ